MSHDYTRKAMLKPWAWPTLDDVREATSRSWCCPLHERVHQLFAVDVDALRLAFVDAPVVGHRRAPLTHDDVRRAVAFLYANVGVGREFKRGAIQAAARNVGGGARNVRSLRDRLVATGVLVIVAPRGRSSRYRLATGPRASSRPHVTDSDRLDAGSTDSDR